MKIDFYATVASHHGTATASIDGGAEVEISYQTEGGFSEDPDTGAGLFIDDEEAMPANVEGLSDGFYVSVANDLVKIPRTGDWTIGVISDEGFALRFVGAAFASAAGNSVIDGNYSGFLSHPTNDANSNVREVLQGRKRSFARLKWSPETARAMPTSKSTRQKAPSSTMVTSKPGH